MYKNAAANDKLTIYLYSGSHWDREWYETFQGFRSRLVDVMNGLIDTLEADPSFQVFHLDGQTIVLEDFLEIEPAKRDRLAALIRDGRLLIGPWYVMPDELLLTGESLIRNLATGFLISSEWGVTPWKYGYVCDIFGHIAQLPQIFNGFGIRLALMGRGTNEDTTPAHFRWQSPDGSECLTFKLPDYHGYGAFFSEVMRPAIRQGLSDEELVPLLDKHIQGELQRSSVPVLILMDGLDHEPVHPETPRFLEAIRRQYPDAEVRHTDLSEMNSLLETYRDRMPIRTGELYEPAKMKAPYLHLITHTLSSRYPLKEANDRCQSLLEKWMMPLVAAAELEGLRIQQTYVEMAYRHLMQNHPHDSICGCSIDQVHKDMEYRFDQTKAIGELVVNKVLEHWLHMTIPAATAAQTTLQADRPGDRHAILLMNPLPFARKEVVTVEFDFPMDYSATYQEPFGYEMKNSFKIYDHEGRECPYGLVNIQRNWKVRRYNQHVVTVNRHTVTFEAELPAMGTVAYEVVPFQEASRYLQTMSANEREAENEYLILTIKDNGTLCMQDKATGRIYDRLLQYADDGEIGDGWYHAAPVNDRTITDTGCECAVERVENGPVRTVFRIVKRMRVPREMVSDRSGIRRSDESVPLTIETRVGLSRGARHVDVETIIRNEAKDHRLKLIVPTGIEVPSYTVNQPFAFIERQAGIRLETAEWRECDVPEKQMGGIVYKRDPIGNGLAFVSPFGLHECAAAVDAEGTLRITLFRSFRQTVMTNGEEGGQLLGPLTFRYALRLLGPDSQPAELIRLQDELKTGVRHFFTPLPTQTKLPDPRSWFSLDAERICVSVIKRPDRDEDGIIVRFINYSDAEAEGIFTCLYRIEQAESVDLNEERLTEAPLPETDGCTLRLRMPAWSIATYRLTLGHSGKAAANP
ncbi:glycoside hydrolase family 38 N-terminal domain-containing protein [Paenibacillus spongiae]|uniref:Glycosyl hydrolase-related protein n=1 Tax=Paenibacillus spongiae TaxID=2909671 RepID=A0ABY5SHC5_9BACL|nr:glycoside hydrolase family 38 C-terminal domain-containing protein [Paenibacillus spongiae]UVI33384.1 glycosyl hydrolase-related protein [Paenibacillus spongiae]